MPRDIHELPIEELRTERDSAAHDVTKSQHRLDHGGAFFDTIEYEEFMENFCRERKRLREVEAELATRDGHNQEAKGISSQPSMSPAHAAPHGTTARSDSPPGYPAHFFEAR